MRVKKAVITAAGRGTRLFPAADTVQKAMLPIIDRDGLTKPVLQVICEEALDSGIEEICVVCAPGDEVKYRTQFAMLQQNLMQAYSGVQWAQEEADRVADLLARVQFAPQESPRGYGHAIWCARSFVGDEPFLLLLGDHLYISHLDGKRCAQQLLDLAAQEGCPVAAVQATREHRIAKYGTLSGRREKDLPGVYRIENIIEKPSISLAETRLQTPGLRAGYYLCFFGIYVLTPHIFTLLAEYLEQEEMQLTPALHALAQQERYLALELKGTRHDTGAPLGLFEAQLALGLSGKVRDAMLTSIVDMLAQAQSDGERR